MAMKRTPHSRYYLCLLALTFPLVGVVEAKTPFRDKTWPPKIGSAVSQDFTGIKSVSKHEHGEGTLSSSKKIPTSHGDEGNDCFKAQAAGLCAAPQHRSSSVSVGAGAGLSLIRRALSGSAEPALRCVAFGAQIAIACYIAKASWKVMKEVWEEVNEEFAAARGFGNGVSADLREEHDAPYADEDAISGGLGDEGGSDFEEEDDGSKPPRRRKSWDDGSSIAPRLTATRELAARLRSSGLPFASESSTDDVDDIRSYDVNRSVEGILRSLTRAEGNVLAQTLLTPLDGGLDGCNGNMESPAVATAAWNAIGGLSDAKESLIDLAFPLLPAQSESDHGMSTDYYGGLLANPPGVLLFGPPGCGKTMLVRALAATIGARFLVVSPSCLLRKYVGETNLNVRALFSVARKVSPCVIFVDELDGLFRERGGEDHDVGRDLKTEFLQLWDGIRHHAPGGGGASSILIIGATNRPFDVDPAFLRRMPRRVFVGLPSYEARMAVLQSMLKHVPVEHDFNLGLVAARTAGYSPSDIREVLQAAALYPLREARAEAMASSGTEHEEGEGASSMPVGVQMPPLRKLCTEDVLRAIGVARPTHFSRRYQRELMNYVRRSEGGSDESTSANPQPTAGSATKDGYYIADANTEGGEYFNGDSLEEGDSDDSYLYDEESPSSDSDHDDL